MLFQEKIDPRCVYCLRAVALDNGQMACPKMGIVSPGGACRKFRYDPLKRVPPRPAAPLVLPASSGEDFSL